MLAFWGTVRPALAQTDKPATKPAPRQTTKSAPKPANEAVPDAISPGSAVTPDPGAIRIQLLSGKTGRPVTAQHIVMLSPDHKFHHDEKTDGEGYATLPSVDVPPERLEVWVDFHRACSKSNVFSFDPVTIRAKGLVTENSCSKHIHMYPQAGTLTFFIRDETFWEKMRH